MNINRIGFSSLYNQAIAGFNNIQNNNSVNFTGLKSLNKDKVCFRGNTPEFLLEIKGSLEEAKRSKPFPWATPENMAEKLCSGNGNSLISVEEQMVHFNDEELKKFLNITDRILRQRDPKKVEYLMSEGGIGERIIGIIAYAGEKNPQAKDTLLYLKHTATSINKNDCIDKRENLAYLDRAIHCLNELHP